MIFPDDIKTRFALGSWGEYQVRQTLRAKGFDVVTPRKGTGGDILACGLRIEVKTAYQNKDKSFRFCLTKDGCTCHLKSDVCVLLLVKPSGLVTTFVIPCIALQSIKNLKLPNPYGYKGKFAEYRKPILQGLKRFIAIAH